MWILPREHAGGQSSCADGSTDLGVSTSFKWPALRLCPVGVASGRAQAHATALFAKEHLSAGVCVPVLGVVRPVAEAVARCHLSLTTDATALVVDASPQLLLLTAAVCDKPAVDGVGDAVTVVGCCGLGLLPFAREPTPARLLHTNAHALRACVRVPESEAEEAVVFGDDAALLPAVAPLAAFLRQAAVRAALAVEPGACVYCGVWRVWDAVKPDEELLVARRGFTPVHSLALTESSALVMPEVAALFTRHGMQGVKRVLHTSEPHIAKMYTNALCACVTRPDGDQVRGLVLEAVKHLRAALDGDTETTLLPPLSGASTALGRVQVLTTPRAAAAAPQPPSSTLPTPLMPASAAAGAAAAAPSLAPCVAGDVPPPPAAAYYDGEHAAHGGADGAAHRAASAWNADDMATTTAVGSCAARAAAAADVSADVDAAADGSGSGRPTKRARLHGVFTVVRQVRPAPLS